MAPVFAAQSLLDIFTWKHNDYPVYEISEFTFFRCLAFKDAYYGRTVSELHAGNLRDSDGRYSSLFPGQRISYWAGDRHTAKKEVVTHRECRNYILFEAYDDSSSTFPSLPPQSRLRIADGRNTGFGAILEKWENNQELSSDENRVLVHILGLDLDCLAYRSRRNRYGENYLFFEKGFRKLALREVRLILGARKNRNSVSIQCAGTSDYVPDLEAYGKKFESIARTTMDATYLDSDEFRLRSAVLKESSRRIGEHYGKNR